MKSGGDGFDIDGALTTRYARRPESAMNHGVRTAPYDDDGLVFARCSSAATTTTHHMPDGHCR